MLAITQFSMAFGQRVLFYDVNLHLNKQIYALVGANGAGKSTFFKLITGEEMPTAGEILLPKNTSIGCLKQDQFKYENNLIQDVVLQGKLRLWQAIQEQQKLLTLDAWDDSQGIRYAELEEIIRVENGYEAYANIAAILQGLGIAEDYHTKPLKVLSGGYKLRVLLAQILFQQPDILLLDEPTNHLDILSIKWMEQFLKNSFRGMVIIISHDVEFIDHVADNILDIDYGEIRQYPGKYARFLAEKQLIQEQKLIERKSAEEKIAHMQKFVERFRAKSSKASQARSRMKMIEKIEVPDIVHSSRKMPHFDFRLQAQSGKIVCKIKSISKAYNEYIIFDHFNFEINRGDKIAIVGANGRGKSTLVKALLGQIPIDAGEISWGNAVKYSYFSQDHHELLNTSDIALSWIMEHVPNSTEQQCRKILAQVLLTKEEVEKNILTLSGGEAARILIAKIMLECPNVIILDEPTNHMDIETIEALAQALENYNGTIILVSHNRYLIQKVANRIVYLPQKGQIQVCSTLDDVQ